MESAPRSCLLLLGSQGDRFRFGTFGNDLRTLFDEDVYEFIVDKALEFKLGARGLRSIVEAVMMDAMYSVPSQTVKKLHVTLEYAKEKFEKSDVNRLQVA